MFFYNNIKDISINFIFFKLNYNYYLSIFFKNNINLYFKFYLANILANKLK